MSLPGSTIEQLRETLAPVKVIVNYPQGTTPEMFSDFVKLVAQFRAAGLLEVDGIRIDGRLAELEAENEILRKRVISLEADRK